MYVACPPRRAHTVSAVAICPPGRCMNRWSRCLEFDAGYSATTASRSMLLSPKPATSNGREPAEGMFSPSRTFRILLYSGWRCSSFDLLDLRLSFAYTFASTRGGRHAPAHETPARDSRLPQRVHPAARLCAKPGGDRTPLRALLARHGAQAPHEPAGQRFHQAGLEPQPIGRDGAHANRCAGDRASAVRLCRSEEHTSELQS